MRLPVKLFDYDLPEELIAQHPPENRGDSRMLVLNRESGECEIRNFTDIVEYLSPGDGLIFNNTRVMSARMYGLKEGTPGAAKIEILLIEPVPGKPRHWKCLLKPGRRVRPGTGVKLLELDGTMNDNDDWFIVAAHNSDGSFVIEFTREDIQPLQNRYGHMPLPPYIRREDEFEDKERYQTIFAEKPGAVAAPTAGLHFTGKVLDEIRAKGVQTSALTLHVGPGTFQPVSVEDAMQHKMHTENFSLPAECAGLINDVHAAGKKIMAVGTTTVRVIESCVHDDGKVEAHSGSTDIFLHPPYKPKAVDMLLTNFHLPKSTLIMLVSTFADREKVMAAYELAKKEKMRFYSYGDCMLLK